MNELLDLAIAAHGGWTVGGRFGRCASGSRPVACCSPPRDSDGRSMTSKVASTSRGHVRAWFPTRPRDDVACSSPSACGLSLTAASCWTNASIHAPRSGACGNACGGISWTSCTLPATHSGTTCPCRSCWPGQDSCWTRSSRGRRAMSDSGAFRSPFPLMCRPILHGRSSISMRAGCFAGRTTLPTSSPPGPGRRTIASITRPSRSSWCRCGDECPRRANGHALAGPTLAWLEVTAVEADTEPLREKDGEGHLI